MNKVLKLALLSVATVTGLHAFAFAEVFSTKRRLNAVDLGKPYTAIVKVSHPGGLCAGVLVNFCTIVTAGHCLGDGAGKLYSSAKATLSDRSERQLTNIWVERFSAFGFLERHNDIAFAQVGRGNDSELPGRKFGVFAVDGVDANQLKGTYCNLGFHNENDGWDGRLQIDPAVEFQGSLAKIGGHYDVVLHDSNGGRGSSGSPFFVCEQVKNASGKVVGIKPQERVKLVAIAVSGPTNSAAPGTDRKDLRPENYSKAATTNAFVERLKHYIRENPCRNLE